ncbi:MAG: hypothetical protein Q9227_002044 [Pyrenula ochraceoflavens]
MSGPTSAATYGSHTASPSIFGKPAASSSPPKPFLSEQSRNFVSTGIFEKLKTETGIPYAGARDVGDHAQTYSRPALQVQKPALISSIDHVQVSQEEHPLSVSDYNGASHIASYGQTDPLAPQSLSQPSQHQTGSSNTRVFQSGPLANNFPSSSAPERLDFLNQKEEYAGSIQQQNLQNAHNHQPPLVPIASSQADFLPPKRNLPFVRSPLKPILHTKFPTVPNQPADSIPKHPDMPSSVHGSDKDMNAKSRKPTEAPRPHTAPEKTTVVQESTKSARRGKKTVTKKQEDKHIPTVEELLQRPDFPPLAPTPDPAPAEKQVKVAKPPSCRTRSKGKGETVTHVDNDPPGTLKKGKAPAKSKSIRTQESDAEMPDVLLPDSQDNQSSKTKASTRRRKPLVERNPNAQMAETTNHLNKLSAALDKDPLFQSSIESETKYADLPPGERRKALETFMCEQLGNPAFRTLCKDLSGMWQSVVLGREVGVEKEW